MKNLIAIALAFTAACGNSSANNEVVGQVKKVKMMTPIICPDYVEADVSLGVMRNGVGSMSHEDITLAVDPDDKETIAAFKQAAENGAIVKVAYDVHRVSWCWPDHRFIGHVVVEATPTVTTP